MDEADDLHISLFREDGKTYGTTTWIWSLVVDGELFVRACNGVHSIWHKAAISQKAGPIHAAGMIKEVAFEAVTEEPINNRIDQAFRNKNEGSPYLPPMIWARSRQANMKITPRSISN